MRWVKTDRRQLARLRKDAAGLGWDDELARLGLANLQSSAHVWCRSVVLRVWAWRGISSNTHNARLAKALHSLLVAEQAARNFTGVHIRQCIVLRDAPLHFHKQRWGCRQHGKVAHTQAARSTHRSQSVHCGWLYRHFGCTCWVRHVAHFSSLDPPFLVHNTSRCHCCCAVVQCHIHASCVDRTPATTCPTMPVGVHNALTCANAE